MWFHWRTLLIHSHVNSTLFNNSLSHNVANPANKINTENIMKITKKRKNENKIKVEMSRDLWLNWKKFYKKTTQEVFSSKPRSCV